MPPAPPGVLARGGGGDMRPLLLLVAPGTGDDATLLEPALGGPLYSWNLMGRDLEGCDFGGCDLAFFFLPPLDRPPELRCGLASDGSSALNEMLCDVVALAPLKLNTGLSVLPRSNRCSSGVISGGVGTALLFLLEQLSTVLGLGTPSLVVLLRPPYVLVLSSDSMRLCSVSTSSPSCVFGKYSLPSKDKRTTLLHDTRFRH